MKHTELHVGQKVKTFLSGEDYRIRSGMLGRIVRLTSEGGWVEHKLVSANAGLIFWATMFYPLTDIEAVR